MKIHDLKTWPRYFAAMLDRTKTFEVRLNDRGYKVGDELWLLEFDPDCQIYTGRRIHVEVTYVLNLGDYNDQWGGDMRGFVVMGLKFK